MEEKKTTKISLSTILLILFIITIAVMAYFIYKLNNDKQLADNKVTELNKQVRELANNVNNLQGTISETSNTINNSAITQNNNDSKTSSNSNTQTTASEKKTFSNDEIKNAIQNYLDLVGVQQGSPEALLETLGFTDLGVNTEKTDDNYIKTNNKYSDYKTKMLDYMTEQWFENNFTRFFKNVNGYLYYFDGGATGLEYEVKSITLKGDYSDLDYIADVDIVYDEDNREQLNMEFHIENYNGKCVISYCD